jgi:hypothetical protein
MSQTLSVIALLIFTFLLTMVGVGIIVAVLIKKHRDGEDVNKF